VRRRQEEKEPSQHQDLAGRETPVGAHPLAAEKSRVGHVAVGEQRQQDEREARRDQPGQPAGRRGEKGQGEEVEPDRRSPERIGLARRGLMGEAQESVRQAGSRSAEEEGKEKDRRRQEEGEGSGSGQSDRPQRVEGEKARGDQAAREKENKLRAEQGPETGGVPQRGKPQSVGAIK
jgi:hypothetical protein